MLFNSLFLTLALCASALGLDTMQIAGFTQGATLSVAQQLGFFAHKNLKVVFNQILAEPAGYQSLINGTVLLLTGTSDDAIDFVVNQNASLSLTGQLDQGPDIVIAGVPNITDITQLKGKPIIVDNAQSGFAFLVRKILQLNGLNIGRDYIFQSLGSTFVRNVDLLNGRLPNGTQVFGTLLTYPFTENDVALNASARPNILARAVDYVNPFLSEVFTVRTASLNNTSEFDMIVRFQSAMLAANMYLNDTRNGNCSVLAIQKTLNISEAVAESQYYAAIDPLTGETTSPGGNFTLNRQALLNVIDLRSQYDGFDDLPDNFNFIDELVTPGTDKFIDYRVRDAAVAGLDSYSPSAICA